LKEVVNFSNDNMLVIEEQCGAVFKLAEPTTKELAKDIFGDLG
jgi:hypothetical protein